MVFRCASVVTRLDNSLALSGLALQAEPPRTRLCVVQVHLEYCRAKKDIEEREKGLCDVLGVVGGLARGLSRRPIQNLRDQAYLYFKLFLLFHSIYRPQHLIHNLLNATTWVNLVRTSD